MKEITSGNADAKKTPLVNSSVRDSTPTLVPKPSSASKALGKVAAIKMAPLAKDTEDKGIGSKRKASTTNSIEKRAKLSATTHASSKKAAEEDGSKSEGEHNGLISEVGEASIA